MVLPRSLCSVDDLHPHLHAQLGVEVGQRLVEQEDLRLAHDRAADGDALALAAARAPSACAAAAARSAGCRRRGRRASRSRPWAGPRSPGRRRGSSRPTCAGRARRTGTPWRCRAWPRGTSFMRWPSISSAPPEISSSPAIIRSSVDLPQPEGPTKTANSPGSIVEVDAVDDLARRRSASRPSRERRWSPSAFPPPQRVLARQSAYFGLSGPIGSATSAPRVGGLVDRGDELERAARVGAASPAAARARRARRGSAHLRGEARADRLSSRRAASSIRAWIAVVARRGSVQGSLPGA